MTRLKAVGAALLCCVATTALLPKPAHAGSVHTFRSKDAEYQSDARYRTLRKAFQKIAGANILADGVLSAWIADPGEIADSACEASVGHRTWGKQEIDVSNALCNSLAESTAGCGVLLTKDKKYLGLIIFDRGGSSGRTTFELIVFKRTHTPVEAGKDDYYARIKSQYL